jgi:hypothetical protein
MAGRVGFEARIGPDLFSYASPPGSRRAPARPAADHASAPDSSGPAQEPADDPFAEHRIDDALFALTLSEITGWPTVRAESPPAGRPRHAVAAPDGTLWDAHGPRPAPPPDLFAGARSGDYLPFPITRASAEAHPPAERARARAAASRVHRSAPRLPAASAPPADACGPATSRQIGFASDISRALRVPMPDGRDAASVSAFIAHHKHGLKGNRGRP